MSFWKNLLSGLRLGSASKPTPYAYPEPEAEPEPPGEQYGPITPGEQYGPITPEEAFMEVAVEEFRANLERDPHGLARTYDGVSRLYLGKTEWLRKDSRLWVSPVGGSTVWVDLPRDLSIELLNERATALRLRAERGQREREIRERDSFREVLTSSVETEPERPEPPPAIPRPRDWIDDLLDHWAKHPPSLKSDNPTKRLRETFEVGPTIKGQQTRIESLIEAGRYTAFSVHDGDQALFFAGEDSTQRLAGYLNARVEKGDL